MRVLITRSREDSEPLAAGLRARGVDFVMAPLLEIEYLQGPPINLEGVQALLATSANGVRAFASREERRHLPVYAVGDATARKAAMVGFTTVESASGDVPALADLIRRRLDPQAGALLHVAGTKLAGDLGGILASEGFEYRRIVLYRAHTVGSLPPAAAEALRYGSLQGVVLFSPRTASTFMGLVGEEGLVTACRSLIAFCLSSAVAKKTDGISWKQTIIARRPDQAAMIDAVVTAQV